MSALIKIVDDWSSALEKGFEMCVIFFDISKAFDTVTHTLLLTKLIELELDPYLVWWIKSYLNKQNSVCIRGWSLLS